MLALVRLNDFCDKIRRFYAPGARVTICSDGRVFGDLVRVDDKEIRQYSDGIQQILNDYRLHSLGSFNLDEAYGNIGYDQMRAGLENDFAESTESLRGRVQQDSATRFLFNGIHRFIFEDRLVFEPTKSRNRVREESKEIAYQVIRRSNAWSQLVESFFPHAVRLSIHPQAASSEKIGIQLIQSPNAWSTPWHRVALQTDDGFWLVKRREAEALGARLSYEKNRYAFFVWQGQLPTEA